MKKLLTFALLLLVAIATQAQAQEASLTQPAEAAVQQEFQAPAPAVVSAAADTEVTTELRIVSSDRQLTQDADDAAVLPTRRGSFWWYVAILVVAGIVLAVVL